MTKRKKFFVRIIKASRPTFWYAKYIGEIFECEYYGGLTEAVILNTPPNHPYPSIGYIDRVDYKIAKPEEVATFHPKTTSLEEIRNGIRT